MTDEIKNRDLFDPDQGARVIPRAITDHDANLFFSMFWGRTDVYAKNCLKNLRDRSIITRSAIIFTRQAEGEYIRIPRGLLEDYCQHYCIVDREIIIQTT